MTAGDLRPIDPTAAPRAGATAPTVEIPDLDRPYRRRIEIRTEAADAAGGTFVTTADLEDDYHRFRVVVEHDGNTVRAIHSVAGRTPWDTCAAAGAVLSALVGVELRPRATDAAAATDPHLHCTHMFDLAALAMANAARGLTERRYDVEVPRVRDRRVQVRLWRDGVLELEWAIVTDDAGRRRLVDPAPYTDAPWKGGFMRWADSHLDPETAEAAIVLRRAHDIGMGRGMPLDDIPSPSALGHAMAGVCFTMQPAQFERARRNRGNIRDFGEVPEALLADTQES